MKKKPGMADFLKKAKFKQSNFTGDVGADREYKVIVSGHNHLPDERPLVVR